MRCTASPDPERLGHLQNTHTLREQPSHLPFSHAVYLRAAELVTSPLRLTVQEKRTAGWFRIAVSIALRPPRRKVACISRMVSALRALRERWTLPLRFPILKAES